MIKIFKIVMIAGLTFLFTLSMYPFKIGSVLAAVSFEDIYDNTDIFEINNYEDLLNFRNTVMNEEIQYDFLGKTVILNTDIDLQNLPWDPIGNKDMAFSGIFDGQGHEIKNLYISKDNGGFIGFFGLTLLAEIKNLTISSARINCKDGSNGALIGRSMLSKVENCKVNDAYLYMDSNLDHEALAYAGLLVGFNDSDMGNTYFPNLNLNYSGAESIIKNCSAQGSIAVNDAEPKLVLAGGLTGLNASGMIDGCPYVVTATIEDCYANVEISGPLKQCNEGDCKGLYLGGLTGANWDIASSSQNGAIINNCKVDCKINANNCECLGYVGGFVGMNMSSCGYSLIMNCSAEGNVTGATVCSDDTSQSYVGGFVGLNATVAAGDSTNLDRKALIENCYCLVDIESSETSGSGGFVGLNSASFGNAEIYNCYSVGRISANSDSISGAFCGYAESKDEKNISYISKCYFNSEILKTNQAAIVSEYSFLDVESLNENEFKSILVDILNLNRNASANSKKLFCWMLSSRTGYPELCQSIINIEKDLQQDNTGDKTKGIIKPTGEGLFALVLFFVLAIASMVLICSNIQIKRRKKK